MLMKVNTIVIRRLSSKHPHPVIPALNEHAKLNITPSAEITPEVRRKNLLVASALFAFVGSVYYYSISKMRGKVIINNSLLIFM